MRAAHLRAVFCVASAALAGLLLSASRVHRAAADDAKQLAYGRHLAQECSTCHRIDGVDNGIPSIIGWQSDLFVTTMDYYRNGARNNPVMISVVQSLDENQLKALASYYGSLPRPPRPK